MSHGIRCEPRRCTRRLWRWFRRVLSKVLPIRMTCFLPPSLECQREKFGTSAIWLGGQRRFQHRVHRGDAEVTEMRKGELRFGGDGEMFHGVVGFDEAAEAFHDLGTVEEFAKEFHFFTEFLEGDGLDEFL